MDNDLSYTSNFNYFIKAMKQTQTQFLRDERKLQQQYDEQKAEQREEASKEEIKT